MSLLRKLLVFVVIFVFSLLACSHNPPVEERYPATTESVAELVSACDKLSLRGAPIDFDSSTLGRLENFKRVLNETVLSDQHFVDVRGIRSNKRVGIKSAKQIILKLTDSRSELSQEIKSQLESLGGLQSPKLWDFYFKSYDKAVAYSDGYLKLFLMADSILPKSGRVADYGAGTGNGSTILESLSPARHLVLIDTSPDGLHTATKKLNLITGNDSSRFESHIMDIKKDKLPPNSLDGAIMNNVLYTVANKTEVLRSVYESLKPGAVLILNDPADIVKQNIMNLRKFMTDVALGAVYNNSPITEYELAMVGAINVQVLMSPKGIFQTPEALKALAEDPAVGFKIRGYYTGYYGATTYLVLQKPN